MGTGGHVRAFHLKHGGVMWVLGPGEALWLDEWILGARCFLPVPMVLTFVPEGLDDAWSQCRVVTIFTLLGPMAMAWCLSDSLNLVTRFVGEVLVVGCL